MCSGWGWRSGGVGAATAKSEKGTDSVLFGVLTRCCLGFDWHVSAGFRLSGGASCRCLCRLRRERQTEGSPQCALLTLAARELCTCAHLSSSCFDTVAISLCCWVTCQGPVYQHEDEICFQRENSASVWKPRRVFVDHIAFVRLVNKLPCCLCLHFMCTFNIGIKKKKKSKIKNSKSLMLMPLQGGKKSFSVNGAEHI